MTTIRSAPPSFAQLPGQVPQRPAMDPDKLAAQRAIFAQLAGTAPAAPAAVATPMRAAEPAVMQQTAPTPRRLMDIPAEQPTKYLRPGSFVDIRV